MIARHPLRLKVNGHSYELEVEPHRTLLDVLRHDLALTGTKSNCQAGECGACTVLVDGRAVNSCLYLAVRAEGAEIQTVEGLAEDEALQPIQEAFVQNAAIQCGYCTPGFLVSVAAVLRENSRPSLAELKKAVEGNICRCTGYTGIVQALAQVADAAEGGR
ncbi:MAG: (2Fe-2S)-binding protein [Anaerolineae bacterium]|nr:MAG: (2Fe-2S)-binding protein [Anaerolineae bacterium]